MLQVTAMLIFTVVLFILVSLFVFDIKHGLFVRAGVWDGDKSHLGTSRVSATAVGCNICMMEFSSPYVPQ